MELSSERPHYALIGKKYEEMQDWSQDKYLVFWFKGEGSGESFSLAVYFDDSYDDYAIFDFADTSSEWRRLVFSTASPSRSKGNVDWSKIWRVSLGSDHKDITGTFYLDHLSRCEDIGGETGIGWFVLQPSLALKAGEHRLNIETEGNVEVKQYVLYSLKQDEAATSIDDLFTTSSSQPTVSYEKISATRYVANVTTSKPSWLVFSESYHPLWKAHVDGETITPVVINSCVNGYYLEKTGSYDVTIEFAGQKYLEQGGLISIIALSMAIIFVILERKGYPPFRKRRRGTKQ
ncbi:hypothetical protein ES703_111083 [subsurface metagenome]